MARNGPIFDPSSRGSGTCESRRTFPRPISKNALSLAQDGLTDLKQVKAFPP
jgi:hypothetical protein